MSLQHLLKQLNMAGLAATVEAQDGAVVADPEVHGGILGGRPTAQGRMALALYD